MSPFHTWSSSIQVHFMLVRSMWECKEEPLRFPKCIINFEGKESYGIWRPLRQVLEDPLSCPIEVIFMLGYAVVFTSTVCNSASFVAGYIP